jgi:hypothetical protein
MTAIPSAIEQHINIMFCNSWKFYNYQRDIFIDKSTQLPRLASCESTAVNIAPISNTN